MLLCRFGVVMPAKIAFVAAFALWIFGFSVLSQAFEITVGRGSVETVHIPAQPFGRKDIRVRAKPREIDENLVV